MSSQLRMQVLAVQPAFIVFEVVFDELTGVLMEAKDQIEKCKRVYL